MNTRGLLRDYRYVYDIDQLLGRAHHYHHMDIVIHAFIEWLIDGTRNLKYADMETAILEAYYTHYGWGCIRNPIEPNTLERLLLLELMPSLLNMFFTLYKTITDGVDIINVYSGHYCVSGNTVYITLVQETPYLCLPTPASYSPLVKSWLTFLSQ